MIYAQKNLGENKREIIFISVQTFLGDRIMPILRYYYTSLFLSNWTLFKSNTKIENKR
jgi:hypothetical protein